MVYSLNEEKLRSQSVLCTYSGRSFKSYEASLNRPRANNHAVRSEKTPHLIIYDPERFDTNPRGNLSVRNLSSFLVIRFLKDRSISFDLIT